MSRSKSTKKICKVCGDKAFGYNFKVVTCESCKAFFRRNALSGKKFHCAFKRTCDITVVTRKFCQKCRLDKCFAVGMCQNLIMTEEQKSAKRRKIEENRIGKHANDSSPVPDLKLSSFHPDSTCLVGFGEASSENKYGMSGNSDYNLLWEGPAMMTSLLPETTSTGLDAVDIMKLEELLEANEAYNSVSLEGPSAKDPESVLNFINYASMKIRRLSKFTEKIHGFRTLCREDQAALLRRAGLDVLLLKRAIDSFNPHTNRLEIRNSTFKSSVDAVRLSHVDYAALQACIEKFDRECLQDKNIILILCAVALFSPDRPNIVHREVIESERQFYQLLLKKYLYSVCAESEVEFMFENMMGKLAEVRRASEGFISVLLKVDTSCMEQIFCSKQ